MSATEDIVRNLSSVARARLAAAVKTSAYAESLKQKYQSARYDGAMWRRWAYAGAAEFPEWFRRYTPPVFGTAFWAALPKYRRIVADNQAKLRGLPIGSLAAQQAAHEVFVEFSRCLTDALEMSGKPDRTFERDYVNQRFFHQAHAKKRGVILVTAHTGSWEVGGRLLSLTRGLRTTMVMAQEGNETAKRYNDELRKRSGVEVLYASGSDPSTALTLLSRLRANEIVAIQMDRPPPSATVIETRFCGVTFPVPEGPFRLAQASGAPLIPVFLHRSGYRRYTFTLDAPIVVARSRDGSGLRDAAQQASTALEGFIRKHPEQWFHFSPLPDA